MTPGQPEPQDQAKKKRIESLDAFRGFTILGMVFVIAIAAGGYWRDIANPLPHTTGWFGSLPVSTWWHAEVGYDIWELKQHESGLSEEEIRALPQYEDYHARKTVGVTFTDLIAPWFVFIVGVCIPLSRSRRGGEWWRHVLSRTLMLIVAGVIYISLVIKQMSWWWGVLQAIGVAYFCGCALVRAPVKARWAITVGLGLLNLVLTEVWPAWTGAIRPQQGGLGTLLNPDENWLKPLTIHCLPWLSISYGVMTMIGVLVGEAIITRDKDSIIRRCLLVGGVFTIAGLAIHFTGMSTSNYSLAFDKPNVSTSYAFFTGGLGALCFLIFYYVIDVLGFRTWATPLNTFGRNPLVAYFLMIVLRRTYESLGVIGAFNRITEDNVFVHNWALFIGGDEPSNAVLAFFGKGGWMGVFWGLVYTALLWIVVWYFNKKKWYWKL